jgi:hypothetical protein
MELPLTKPLEVGTYKLKEGILKIMNDVDWFYFDPTGQPPPPEVYQLKYVPHSGRFIGNSPLYLTAFDKYMDVLHKPMAEQFDDFVEMITKVDIVEYVNLTS